MGINIFLSDRRPVVLSIGGIRQSTGTLRRFFKVTELDAERRAERDAAATISPSPRAAIVMDATEMPLASDPECLVHVRLVIG